MTDFAPLLGAVSSSLPYACVALAAVTFGVVMLVTRFRRALPRRSHIGFEERMADLGMEAIDDGYSGTIDGRPIRVIRFEDPASDPPLVMEVSTTVPTGRLTLGIGDSEQTEVRGVRHIGDESFDPWFEVDGEIEELALLTADVRRTLRNAARNTRPRIGVGWLTMSGSGHADIDARLAPLVAVASAIQEAAIDPSTRIRRFSQDPAPGVRMRCLEILSARPASPLTVSVARDRLDDPDPVVRTLAAVLAKESGRLVTIVQSDDAPPGVRRRAARALLQTGSKEEQLAAATALAAGPAPLHPIAWELCEPLGAGGEPVLIALVASPNMDVAKGAAGKLGKIGSIRAIPALREFQDRTGQVAGPLRPELAQAIQSMRPKPSGSPRSLPAGFSAEQISDEPTRELPAPSFDDRRTPAGRTIRRTR